MQTKQNSENMDRTKLKGGIATRKGSTEYNRRHDAIRKKCGCTFGEKCGKMCKKVKKQEETP